MNMRCASKNFSKTQKRHMIYLTKNPNKGGNHMSLMTYTNKYNTEINTLEDLFLIVFTIFDDAYGDKVPIQLRTNKNKPKPKLSDTEIMTISVICEILGFESEKAWHSYVKNNFKHLFPNFCGRETYIRRKQNLYVSMLYMRQYITHLFNSENPSYSIVDSMPMKACHYARAKSVKVFRGDAGFGFCAAKNEKYYGFKFHARVSAEGFIQEYSVADACKHDVKSLLEICEHNCTPKVLGDKGYVGKEWSDALLRERGALLEVPTKSNSKEPMSKNLEYSLGKKRKRVEITFSQLVEQFKFNVIKSKTTNGLSCRVLAKVLGHNLLYLINQFRGAKNVSNIKSLVYN
jgi:hypothetical protein